jgi:hypothetical protein
VAEVPPTSEEPPTLTPQSEHEQTMAVLKNIAWQLHHLKNVCVEVRDESAAIREECNSVKWAVRVICFGMAVLLLFGFTIVVK